VAVCWDLLRDPSDSYKKLVSRLSHNGLLTKDGMSKKAYFEWQRLQKNSPPAEAPKGHKRALSEGVPLPPPISAERAVGLTPPIKGEFPQVMSFFAPPVSPSCSFCRGQRAQYRLFVKRAHDFGQRNQGPRHPVRLQKAQGPLYALRHFGHWLGECFLIFFSVACLSLFFLTGAIQIARFD